MTLTPNLLLLLVLMAAALLSAVDSTSHFGLMQNYLAVKAHARRKQRAGGKHTQWKKMAETFVATLFHPQYMVPHSSSTSTARSNRAAAAAPFGEKKEKIKSHGSSGMGIFSSAGSTGVSPSFGAVCGPNGCC